MMTNESLVEYCSDWSITRSLEIKKQWKPSTHTQNCHSKLLTYQYLVRTIISSIFQFLILRFSSSDYRSWTLRLPALHDPSRRSRDKITSYGTLEIPKIGCHLKRRRPPTQLREALLNLIEQLRRVIPRTQPGK